MGLITPSWRLMSFGLHEGLPLGIISARQIGPATGRTPHGPRRKEQVSDALDNGSGRFDGPRLLWKLGRTHQRLGQRPHRQRLHLGRSFGRKWGALFLCASGREPNARRVGSSARCRILCRSRKGTIDENVGLFGQRGILGTLSQLCLDGRGDVHGIVRRPQKLKPPL